MTKSRLFFAFLVMGFVSRAQSRTGDGIISGPMLGQVELRTATLWLEVAPTVKNVVLKYWKKDDAQSTAKTVTYRGELGREFNPLQMQLGGLDINSRYQYEFLLDGKSSNHLGEFLTKDLWEWRKPAPDFSFLTGSCAYFNDSLYDRPGKPYGGGESIFETMSKMPSAFMLWLGDNWYTREVDIQSRWGLWYRAGHDRATPSLQHFLKSMAHYAIWDDHDFGPDDSDGSYPLKEISREVFMSYWANPSYGQDGKGVYTKISYADVDLFLTDDRYFRSANDLADSINGKPNVNKHYFGTSQMEWLKNALAYSKASFKIIATGSQVLNPISNFECMRHYSAEYTELMDFLDQQKISGVIFLTGDRHHSEVLKAERAGNYTLYDITSSPLTSGVAKVPGPEIANASRIPGTLVEERNFSRISITGKPTERKLTVDFIGADGHRLATWSIDQRDLRTPGH